MTGTLTFESAEIEFAGGRVDHDDARRRHLGQRVAEQTLDSLARLLAAGQARVVTAERARLIDRAWHATLNALRSFAGRSTPTGEPA